jgi:hypothetical protein
MRKRNKKKRGGGICNGKNNEEGEIRRKRGRRDM